MFTKRLYKAILTLSLSFAWVRGAFALDPWEFEVYPYRTIGKGMFEAGSLNAIPLKGHNHPEEGTSGGIFPSEHLWYTALEFAYGITSNLEAAAYLNFALPQGDEFWYAGSKYRLRGNLFHEEALPVNIGWYAEIEQHHTPQFDADGAELDLRPIFEKELGLLILRLNPQFEKPVAKAGWEFGASSGIYYRLSREVSPGLEIYDDLGGLSKNDPISEQQHYLVPVIYGSLPGGLEYSTGLGFGLTRNSDKLVFKINLELEKFLGSLF